MKYIILFLLLSCSIGAMDIKEQQTHKPVHDVHTNLTYLQLKVLSSLKDLKEAEKLYAKSKTEQNKRLVQACNEDHTAHYHQLMVLEGQEKERRHKAKSKKRPPAQPKHVRSDSMTAVYDASDSGSASGSPFSSDVSS